MVGEHLVLDPGRPVLADVARLGREDDRRLALEREQNVGVAVDDLEAGEVRDRALEAGVLAAGDEHGVEPVAPPAPRARGRTGGRALAHDLSTPLISAATASFSGVGTPCSRPKRTMPPFR